MTILRYIRLSQIYTQLYFSFYRVLLFNVNYTMRMSAHTFFYTFLACWVLSCFSMNTTLGAPNYFNSNYSDYLPRYRTLSEAFLISKIEYTATSMILSVSYVASADDDKVVLYGSNHTDSWKLKTGNGSKASSAYAILKNADVLNIKVNEVLKLDALPSSGRRQFVIGKGDLLSCELHFERLPSQVRTAHLIGGDRTEIGAARINCQDIQIKTKDNKTLGSTDQMEANLERFYRNNDVGNPSTENMELAQKEAPSKPSTAPIEKPLEHSLKPINYMPKEVASIDDMACNERLILSNVYFQDNKADFAGRLKAMKTINVVVDYLRFHPNAKIVLHGHTDIFGSTFKNLELSKKRVWTVKTTIVGRGIDDSRIITVHHGGSQPLIKYKNGGSMNRRVEVEILCMEKQTGTSVDAAAVK